MTPDIDALLDAAAAGDADALARLDVLLEAEDAGWAERLAPLASTACCPTSVVTAALADVRRAERPAAAPPRAARRTRAPWIARAAGVAAALLVGVAAWIGREPIPNPLPGPGLAVAPEPSAVLSTVEQAPPPARASADSPAGPAVSDRRPGAAPAPRARTRPAPPVTRRETRSAPRTPARAPARASSRAAPDAQAVREARAELALAFAIVGRAQRIATETVTDEARRAATAVEQSRVF